MIFLHPRPTSDQLISFQYAPSLVGVLGFFCCFNNSRAGPHPQFHSCTILQLFHVRSKTSHPTFHVSLRPKNRTLRAQRCWAERINTGAKDSLDAGAGMAPAPSCAQTPGEAALPGRFLWQWGKSCSLPPSYRFPVHPTEPQHRAGTDTQTRHQRHSHGPIPTPATWVSTRVSCLCLLQTQFLPPPDEENRIYLL